MRPGPELAAHNRRRTARLESWPRGVAEACEQIAAAFPDWFVSWTHGFQYGYIARPEGYRAWQRHGRLEVGSPTGAGLVSAIECAPER